VINKIYPLAILFALIFSFGCKKDGIPKTVSNTIDTTSTVAVSPTVLSISSTSFTTTVFQHLTNGYQMYRIPALLTTVKGTLLAFCEARKLASSGDSGDIDVVFKRSTNGGSTWSDQQIVFNDGSNTCGNPTLVQDRNTNTIWLLMSHNPGQDVESAIINNSNFQSRTVWVSRSDDDGITWSIPQDITSSVKDPKWAWYATGPGTGIQIAHGNHAGRLIIPCDHSYLINGKIPAYGSHIIYSDDDGITWRMGGSTGPATNECQVVELNDGKGTLLMNARYFNIPCTRAQSFSYDGGTTWTSPVAIPSLIDPNCEGSLYGYASKCILLSNCDTSARANLTLKSSFDNGLTWNRVYTIYNGPAAYSSLSVLPTGAVECLFEAGQKNPYDGIVYSAFKTSLR